MGTRIFVGNLGFQVTRDQLVKAFSEFGRVVSVNIPVDRLNHRPRGFAFVEFLDQETAEEALLSLDGMVLGGRRLRLSPAMDRSSGQRDEPRPGREEFAREVQGERSGRGIPSAPNDAGTDREDLAGHGAGRRERKRKGGRHGCDRLRGRGTHRFID